MNNKVPINPTATINENDITNESCLRLIPKLRGGMIRDNEMTESSEITNS